MKETALLFLSTVLILLLVRYFVMYELRTEVKHYAIEEKSFNMLLFEESKSYIKELPAYER